MMSLSIDDRITEISSNCQIIKASSIIPAIQYFAAIKTLFSKCHEVAYTKKVTIKYWQSFVYHDMHI